MLPGARGASAAGLFEIARKISTVPLIVRQAFQYVLGPLSSAQAHVDRAQVAPLYHFASRVSTALVVPLAGLLVFAGVDMLSLYRPEAQARCLCSSSWSARARSRRSSAPPRRSSR